MDYRIVKPYKPMQSTKTAQQQIRRPRGVLDPRGLALRNLGRIRKNLRHRSPQSWGGSDRTKFYHPPLPSAGGRRPPIIPPSRPSQWWSPPFWNRRNAVFYNGFKPFWKQTHDHLQLGFQKWPFSAILSPKTAVAV